MPCNLWKWFCCLGENLRQYISLYIYILVQRLLLLLFLMFFFFLCVFFFYSKPCFRFTQRIRLIMILLKITRILEAKPAFLLTTHKEKILQMVYVGITFTLFTHLSSFVFWGLHKVNICGILLPACIVW